MCNIVLKTSEMRKAKEKNAKIKTQMSSSNLDFYTDYNS